MSKERIHMDYQPRAVVLGSSPIMMLWALHYMDQGYSVTMLEQRSTIGGAWYTKSCLGFDRLEPGYHIIENRPVVYQYLRQQGVLLNREKTWALYRGIRISYGMSQFLTYARRFAQTPLSDKAQIHYHWDKVRMSGRNLMEPFYYPDLGAHGVVRALASKLESNGINIRTDARVHRIHISHPASKPQIYLDEQKLEVDKLILSSRAHAPIVLGDEEIKINIEYKKSTSLLLKISGKKLLNFSCIRILRDPIVIRVRDVGIYSKPTPSTGTLLFCVQVRKVKDVPAYFNQVLDALVRNKILEPGASVMERYIEEYISPTILDTEADRLSKLVGLHLEIKKTTDLGNELEAYKKTFGL